MIRAIEKIIKWRYFPQALLFFLVIIGYWQVSSFQHPLKYDIIDCTYPWKYFVGECLHNHILPLWNPYQSLGYPIYADPQVGVWYPFTWIIGYLRGYDIYSIQFEFIFHIYFAAIGMFLLGRTLKFSRSVSLIMAVCYMFSGFFIGNSQHYMMIASGTWIPFVINYYIRFSEHPYIKESLYASFFMFMLLSGGYPGLIIIFSYFLFALFIYYSIGFIKNKKLKEFTTLLKYNFIFIFSTALFSSIIIISAYTITKYITRGEKLPLEIVLSCPFSPQSLISLIVPFAVIKDPAFFNTDISMTNIYFGLILLIFFIASFFVKKQRVITLFFWSGVFCLLASMGGYLPVRKFLYDFIPMMGFFRLSSLFRLFTIIFFIIVSGYALQIFIYSEKINIKKIKITAIAILIFLVLLIIWAKMHGYLSLLNFIRKYLFTDSDGSNIWQHIAFQSIVQLFFLSMFLLALWKIKNKIKLLNVIALITIADMVFASWLNEPYTTYSGNLSTKSLKEYSNTFPINFPIPSSENIITHTDAGLGYEAFWRNMNIFHKQIAWDGFTSFKLKKYDYLDDSLHQLLMSVLSNPPVFLTDKVFPVDSMQKHCNENKYCNKNIYLYDNDYIQDRSYRLSNSLGDTAYITSFSPVRIKVRVSSKESQILTLLQNYFPGWEAKINGVKSKIVISDKCFMSVKIPKGISEIEFSFSSTLIKCGLYITISELLLFFIFLSYSFLRNYQINNKKTANKYSKT